MNIEPSAPPVEQSQPRPAALPSLPLAAWLQPALALPLIEIALDATIQRRVSLHSPACAIARGRIGQRLRDLRCLTGARSCAGCPVVAGCDYAQVCEVGSPHPFWFQGVPASTELEPGTAFTARMYIAAPAHAIAQYLDVALRDAVRAIDPTATVSPTRWRQGSLGALLPTEPPGPLLHLRSESPLRLRGDLETCARMCPSAPWFALLVRAGVRRVDALVRRFAPSVDGRLPRAALPDLTRIQLIGGAMTPWSSSRFSHRQHRRMPLEGVHGDAILHGEQLAEVAPLCAALTVTSVGKATSFGFGTLRVVQP